MAAKTPTLAEFKSWSKDCAPAAKAVLMARVYADMERERVDAYIRPIFDSYHFTYGAHGRERQGHPIESPKHLYCCDDEVQLKCYYADCDDAHRAHGFTGPIGHCPALTAEHLLIVTEGLLFDLAEPLLGIDGRTLYGENRAKYLELLIGACFAKK